MLKKNYLHLFILHHIHVNTAIINEIFTAVSLHDKKVAHSLIWKREECSSFAQ